MPRLWVVTAPIERSWKEGMLRRKVSAGSRMSPSMNTTTDRRVGMAREIVRSTSAMALRLPSPRW